MSQAIKTGYKTLCEAAEREIETLPVEEAIKLTGRDDTVLVDVRDVRELERDGRVPGAFHCPKTSRIRFWAFSYSTGEPCGRSNQLIMYFIWTLFG